MSSIRDEILKSNQDYAQKVHPQLGLDSPSAPRFLILTCKDARLDPVKFAGLKPGDAHVFRNAGGRATDDAIRSLVISHKFFGTREWFVIHHTDCGLERFTDSDVGNLFERSLGPAEFDGDHWRNLQDEGGSASGRDIRWMTIADREQSVIDDVRTIREHPLVSPEVAIYGFLYDVHTGRLTEIEEASAIGRPVATA